MGNTTSGSHVHKFRPGMGRGTVGGPLQSGGKGGAAGEGAPRTEPPPCPHQRTNTALTPALAQPPESWVHRERGWGCWLERSALPSLMPLLFRSPDAASSSGWYLGKRHPSILRTGAGLRQSRRRGDGPPAGKSHPFSPWGGGHGGGAFLNDSLRCPDPHFPAPSLEGPALPV